MKVRINWKRVAIALAVLPVAALFVAWLGFFNVGAASGHWKITEWFLHFAMRSAVRTYALPIATPDGPPPVGVRPAAGHYAAGCAMCHGAPGAPRGATVRAMLPAPPALTAAALADWSDAELFRIVKHGLRFTGMPAWPAQARDDEVWAMVAFLRRLPELAPRDYRSLAYGEAPPDSAGDVANRFEGTLAGCARCHGRDGTGGGETVPVIAGQRPAYLAASLAAYAEGRRASGIMQLAAGQADATLFDRLARHYAGQSAPAAPPTDAAPELIERGRAIARRGIPERDVPACLGCHGRPERNPVYPGLDGQRPDYLANQLRLFAAGVRGGTPYSHLMTAFADELTVRERAALAAYFASRPAP